MRAKRLFTVSPERNRNMGTMLHRMRVPSRNLSAYPNRASFAQVLSETLGKATLNTESIEIVPIESLDTIAQKPQNVNI